MTEPGGIRSRQGFRILLLCSALIGCDDYPRDPENTLQHVLASKEMTVAAVDHGPWVRVKDETPPTGAEVALVEAFAEDLGVSIEWQRMAGFEAIEALKQGEIDLAIGGFAEEEIIPHAGAAPSYAYFRGALVVGARPGAPIPDKLEGLKVAVSGPVAAGSVRHKDGIPAPEMGGDVALAAVENWQLSERDLVHTGIALRKRKHVMAVPQGENAWLMRLERFLRANSDQIPGLLRKFQQ